MYCLDSDICIELMRGRLPYICELMQNSDPSLFGIPAVVEGELRTGALKSRHPKKNTLLVERFLAPFKSVPFGRAAAISYGKIRADLEAQGMKIGPNDLLIAATALSAGSTLITHNVREFTRVKGLSVEDWEEIELE